MKKCPYCAENIQDEAIVCRYCGRDLRTSSPWRRVAVVVGILFLTIFILTFVAVFFSPYDNRNTQTGILTQMPILISTYATTQENRATRLASAPTVYPTPDISKCIRWDDLDTGYLGDDVCIRGVITKIVNARILSTSSIYFSDKPNAPYLSYFIFPGDRFHVGDCIIVAGRVSTDENKTLLVYSPNTSPILLCP